MTIFLIVAVLKKYMTKLFKGGTRLCF